MKTSRILAARETHDDPQMDVFVGTNANETYVVDNIDDIVIEAPGGGTDRVLTTLLTYTLPANVENLMFIGSGNFTGTGNELANVIIGQGGDDVLSGGLGADTLLGQGGNDWLDGGTGAANQMQGGVGDDTYVVSAYGDTLVEFVGEGVDTVRTSLDWLTLRANVENLIYTGAGNFTGIGNASANAITGGAGGDVLDGLTGADVMTGLGGDDAYWVDDAGDQAVEAADAGQDTVRTTLNTLTLFANVETLIFTGAGAFTGTGNGSANRIIGASGADTLDGAGGDDILVGGAGADFLEGGAGYDFVDYSTSVADLTIRLGNANVQMQNQDGTGSADTLRNIEGVLGGYGNDALIGSTNGHDTLNGGFGNDTLSGQGGNDILIGGAGVDAFAGGLGDDTYYLDGRFETVVEQGAGGGNDTVYQADLAYVMAAGIENLIFNGVGAFTGTGNTLANTIAGGASDDVLMGMAGNDILIGGAGIDQLDGGEGDDIVSYAASSTGVIVNLSTNFQADGGGVSDVMTSIEGAIGSAFADTLIASDASSATFIAGAGDDTLTGGDLNDRLMGGLGADTMTGGLGNDVYEVDQLGDVYVENADEGVDTIQTSLTVFTLGANFERLTYTGASAFTGTGTSGDNVIVGGSAGDLIEGLGGADTLNGGAGGDTLNGGAGDDVLIGGQGVDIMNGGDGVDTLDYSAQTAAVRVNLLTNVVNADGQGATDTISNFENLTGGSGADTLIGNGGDNVIIGGNGSDTLVGLGGNDFLAGGSSPDALQGGLGDDTYYAPDGGDTLIEFANEGTDTIVSAFATYSLADNFENLSFVSPSIVHNGFGNSVNNTITGGDVEDFLHGLAGDDTLIGGGGGDFLAGNDDADTLIGGVGDDNLNGGTGSDTAVMMGLREDYIITRLGNGNVSVVDGNAAVDGDDGTDTLVEMEFVRFSDGTILDLSTLPPPASAAAAADKDADDAFVLPGMPDGDVFLDTSEPLVLPGADDQPLLAARFLDGLWAHGNQSPDHMWMAPDSDPGASQRPDDWLF